ncbi:MAG: efflux RND transporter periplasmic adaptor subunit [Gemmatimonadota bacterium]|nr:efflux RND transporter periplasmic adaptor subunit [Gemmatimonadota bacterium]
MEYEDVRILLTTVTAAFLIAAMGVAGRRLLSSPRSTVVDRPEAVAAVRTVTRRVIATGTVRLAPGAKVDVGARVSGVVRRLAVQQGMRIARGDVVAQLDDREAQLRLAGASARVAELKATVAQARADVARLLPLEEKGFAAPRDLDYAETALTQAQARLASAIADESMARVQLGYMTVKAPESGTVAAVTIHEGETVAASFATPTFVTLVDLSQLECVALVDETDIGRVHIGDSAEFTVDAYPGRVFRGQVVRIAPDATVISGVVDYETTIRVTGDTAETSRLLRPQMTASVTIEGPSSSVLVVPSNAVRQSGSGPYVWKVSAGEPARVPVSTVVRQSDYTSIARGLVAGDTVLTGKFPDTQP